MSKEIIEEMKKTGIDLRKGLLSVKNDRGYPQLIEVNFIRKEASIYLAAKNLSQDKHLPLDSQINYALISYNQFSQLDLNIQDSLIVVARESPNHMNNNQNISSFIDRYSQEKAEIGSGFLSGVEGQEDLIKIRVDKTSKNPEGEDHV